MCLFYLVFGIDEAVVDELLVVAVLTDAVDCRSGVQVLGGGHLMIMIMMMVMIMMVMVMMMVVMVMVMVMMVVKVMMTMMIVMGWSTLTLFDPGVGGQIRPHHLYLKKKNIFFTQLCEGDYLYLDII